MVVDIKLLKLTSDSIVAPVPFPKDRLAAVNITNPLSDGRYLQTSGEDTEDLSGQFEVFHQLHCLVITPFPRPINL